VLAVATREDSLLAGVKLLLAYSLGLGIPFILAAVAIRPFLSFMQKFRAHLGRVEKVMGGLLVGVGLLFLFGQMNLVGNWMLDTFPGLAKVEESFTPKSLQVEIMKQSAPK
jgi:cytochrome c-type biogenesis protein